MASMSLEPLERLGSENHADDGGWDLRSQIAGYPKPLLLFAAGRDSVIPAADLATLGKNLGGNARVAVFPESGHNLHRTDFDAFVAEVEAFLLTS